MLKEVRDLFNVHYKVLIPGQFSLGGPVDQTRVKVDLDVVSLTGSSKLFPNVLHTNLEGSVRLHVCYRISSRP